MAKARDSKGQFASGNSSGDGSMSHLTLNAIVGQAVHNAQYSQPRGGSNTPGGSLRRDIDDECGFPKRGLITLEDYTYLFERCSIAARVVELEPREAWKVSPSVYEDEDSETVTKFEEGLNELGKKLQGESWFETGEDESGSVIWQKLQLVDELSGIGSFGALLLGLDDSDDLSKPALGIKDDGTSGGGGENTTRELLYLRAYSQTMVKIDGYVTDKSNPRYGLPEYYNIQVAGYDTSSVNPGDIPDTGTIRVHWSRVIHVADIWHQSSASDVFAIPRMRPVYNEVLSCRKIAGASGEFYWNHGSRDLIIETHPQLGGKVRFPSDMKSQIEQFETGLQRSLRLSGASAKTLNPAVSDPTPHLMIQVKLICIKKGCPERIFWGSERGELASSQDERGWADRVMGRQNGYVTPRIIVPFINRCIQLGVLPKPKQYYIVWPNLRELSPQERAVVVAARVEAMVKYVGGNVYQVMAPADFLTRELDYTQEETVEILKAAQEEEEDMLEKQKALQPEPKFGEEGEQPPGQGEEKKKKEGKEGDGEKKGGPTTHAYNPSQSRDVQGKFGSGGGGGGGAVSQIRDAGFRVQSQEDFESMDPQAQQVIADRLTTLATEYPGVQDEIHSIRVRDDLGGDPVLIHDEGVGGRYLHVSSSAMSPKKYAQTERETVKAQKSGLLASEGGVGALIDHEVGHVIDQTSFRHSGWGAGKAKSYIRKNPPTAKTLSRYGMTSKKETFAEAFSASTSVKNPNAWQQGFNTALRGK